MTRCQNVGRWAAVVLGFALCGPIGLVPLMATSAGAAEPQKPSRTAYVLDNDRFARELAEATTEEHRRKLFDARWESIKLAIAHVHVATHNSFHTSMLHWRSGETWPTDIVVVESSLRAPIQESDEPVTPPGGGPGRPPADPEAKPQNDGEKKPNAEGEKKEAEGDKKAPGEAEFPRARRRRTLEAGGFRPPRMTMVHGDCLADVRLYSDSKIHIYGDLGAKLSIAGQCEVIIAGSVRESGSIETDGIARIFVGGDLAGDVRNLGSSMLWVHGNLSGDVLAGTPSTEIHVMGDWEGLVQPSQRAGMLAIEVRGYAPMESLKAIEAAPFSKFDASIAESNCEPGLYPREEVPGGLGAPRSRSNHVWAIHKKVERKE